MRKLRVTTNKLYLLFALLYVAVLWLLVEFEKQNPDSNIKNLYDGLWYSVVTLTTVGYGDFYPVTPIGKILGLVVIFSSLGVLGFLIGNFTNVIRTRMEKKKQGYFGTHFTNHFVIIGWDNYAKSVTDQIIRAKGRVAVVTNNSDDLELIGAQYSSSDVFTLLADYNNHEQLLKVNIDESNAVFINFSDDAKTLIYVINLKKRFKVNAVVALETAELKETFQNVGVKHIIAQNDITSKIVASYIFEPDVAAFTEELMETSVDDDDFDMYQYKVIDSNSFIGKNCMDAFVELKQTYNAILVGVAKTNGEKRVLYKNPGQEVEIKLGDYLILISDTLEQLKIENDFGVTEGVCG